MTVVLDTNVVLQGLAAGHPFEPILDAAMAGAFVWAISTDVLMEYEEVLTRVCGRVRWAKLALVMDLTDADCGTLLRVTPYFHFRAVPADRDDDKFADCAIAADGNWIVTEDRHFNALIGAGYKPQPITPEEFIRRFLRV